jgi:RNA polymerase sigma factor (sigma-70 family)
VFSRGNAEREFLGWVQQNRSLAHLSSVDSGQRSETMTLEGQRETSAGIGAVFVAEHDRLVRVAYLLTGSTAVAEDVVQDAFVHLHSRWDGVREPAAYLRVSVVNGCRAHHRRNHRESARFPELVRVDVKPETPVVLDALAGLPYRQRVALVLRFYEDRPDDEIAVILGCRPATVRSLVHRGLTTLRKAITQ